MADYTPAPNSMFGNIEQNGQTGMLGGYLQSIANEFSMKQQQDGIRDRDLGFMEKMRAYQMQQKEDEARVGEFQNRKEAAARNSQLDSEGVPLSLARSAAATQLDSNQASMQKNAVQKLQDAGEFLNEVNQQIGDRKLDPMNQNDMSLWRDAQERGAKIGVTLPPAPTPEAQALVKSKADAYYNSAAFRQKQQLQGNAQASQESIHAGNNAAMVEAARIRADADKYHAPPDPRRTALTDIMARVKETGTATQADLDQVKAMESAAIQNIWEKNGSSWKSDVLTDMRMHDEKYRTEFKKQNQIQPDATPEQVSVIMADRRLQEAANKHARGLLGNPKVVDADVAPPSNPAAAASPPRDPARSASGTIGGSPTPTVPPAGKRSNEELIAAGLAQNPGSSREEIISLIKKAGKWQ